jgi:RHS repeat-associated protein
LELLYTGPDQRQKVVAVQLSQPAVRQECVFMKSLYKTALFALTLLSFCIFAQAQSSPNLENGWKPFGSYDGTKLDTVNVMNGNLMLHLPIMPDVPQRGSLKISYSLYGTSKDWQVSCFFNQNTQKMQCSWVKGGGSIGLRMTPGDLTIHRTLDKQFTGGQGNTTFAAYGYTIISPDGATHQVHGVAGTEDVNGEPTEFDSTDLSGYHLILSIADGAYPTILTQATVIDREGNQYQGSFGPTTGCGRFQFAGLSAPGGHPPPFDDAPAGDLYCSQVAYVTLVTDSNGNQISIHGPLNPNPTTDTLGKTPAVAALTPTSDYSGCVSSHPFYSAAIYNYIDPNGVQQQIKACTAEISIQTAFNQPNPYAPSVMVGEAVTGGNVHVAPIVSVVLADGTRWTFDYDNYGLLTYVGMPTGGSISYIWTTIDFSTCDITNVTKRSRAVATRTLNDGQGHTYQWHYTWGTPSNTNVTNTVTDPLGNDTVHVFTSLAPSSSTVGCNFYETSTIQYAGAAASSHPVQRVDTTYSSASVANDDPTMYSNLANVFATDIVTTVYPSSKVKKVHKDPDPGLGPGLPIFGNTIKEQVFDWGQGQAGSLLRETDTVYQWQKTDLSGNRPYLVARLLDLPASVVILSGNSAENTKSGCPISLATTGNCMAETDYSYDEINYLTNPSPTVATQHVSPPYGVRGNQTTVSRWLNPGNSFISSHTKWYDTGEPYQKMDPLGHTTTYTYDPIYVGAYVTQTCSPQTSGVSHCVSGTYDFNSGLLTSLTNENATTQANGNSPGDAAHTSSYSYDLMFRLTSAQLPPDPLNGGMRAQNNFSFSSPNTLPITAQRSKSVTTALSDVTTAFFDGLGRAYKGQHTLPNGTATVDTTFDLAGRPATVSNPYFSTSDTTYGVITNLYDALDRVTQTTKQDGSISHMQYSIASTIAVNGDCTISTDEAGKERGACTDGLGRLVEVDEPNPGGTTVSANYHAAMQTDGNFVLYNTSGVALWSTGPSTGVMMEMQDDGNLVEYHQLWQAGTYRAPSGATSPYDACSIGPVLHTGQVLHDNQCLESHSGMTFALMSNGELQIYDRQLAQITWHSNTYGHPGSYAVLQSDGNLVVYDANNNYLWASWSFGASLAELEDDGRLIIYNPVWWSNTSQSAVSGSYAHPACDVGYGTGWTGVLGTGSCFVSRNGRFELLLQTNGNMVIYDRSVTPNTAIWSTNTAVSPADPGFAMRTLYTYDALGNLLRVNQKGTAPNDSTQWRTRTFTYDSLSRLLTATNPESGTISYTYDADGNLLMKTSPAPNQTGSATQTISYCYDELHRVTSREYGVLSCPLASPVVSYTYDSGANAKGKLTQMTDQSGTATYSYDVMGRLSAETRSIAGISKSISYTYDLGGTVKTLTYPSNRVVTFTSDSAGRLVSAADGNGTNYVSSANYGPDNSLTNLVNGSVPALSSSFRYNPRLQLCRITTLSSGTLPTSCNDSQHFGNVMDRGYDFHAGNGAVGSGTDNGNVIGITNYRDSTRSQSFTYDALNRLTSAWSTANTGTYSWGESYSIDAWGNLQITPMSGKAHGGNFTLSSNAQNRPTGLGYDAAGNLTSYLSATYTYDEEDRLLSTAGNTYTYDGNGERVSKSQIMNNVLTPVKFYWSMSGNTLSEADGSGNITSEYVYLAGKRVARIDLPANTVHYYFMDHLGSTSIVATAAGAVEEESDYYPFGTEVVVTGAGANEFKFTGKEHDSETGLNYFSARYYSNGLGRWTSPDWSEDPTALVYADLQDPQSINLYGYVRNNPLRFVDSDGHDYHVCGPDGGNCHDYTDKQYDQWLKDNPNVKQSPGGTLESCGQGGCTQVGSALYFNPDTTKGLAQLALASRVTERYIGTPLVVFLTVAVPGALTTALPEASSGLGTAIASGVAKAAAKQAVEESTMTAAQKAAVKRAIARATTKETVSVERLSDGSIRVLRTRPGFDGKQVISTMVDVSGKSTPVQIGVNTASEITHYDPK